MKKLVTVLIFLMSASAAYSLSAGEVRAILEKPAPTVLDALTLVSAIDNPEIQPAQVETNGNSRIAGLNQNAPLTAGDFGIIAIERKKASGGLFYSITGLGKYAAESLVHQKLMPATFYFSRGLTGKELIELVTALQEKNQPAAK